MAESYEILGQSAPSATTSTTLYTGPSSTKTVVSVVTVCNRSSTPATFRLGVDDAAGGDGNSDYLYYDCPIAGNETLEVARGIILEATDLLRVYASTANLTFAAFGVKIT